jgi:hypothetical protein
MVGALDVVMKHPTKNIMSSSVWNGVKKITHINVKNI